jgi:peptide deformylase
LALILDILQWPDSRLERVCQQVTEFGEELLQFSHDLAVTRRHFRGVGLAAPQVGDMRRIISLNPGKIVGYELLINPTIVTHGNNKSFGDEGCLSVDHGKRTVRVKRWDTITVAFQTIRGEHREVIARGFSARVLQHEIDHLDGKLIA